MAFALQAVTKAQTWSALLCYLTQGLYLKVLVAKSKYTYVHELDTATFPVANTERQHWGHMQKLDAKEVGTINKNTMVWDFLRKATFYV
eukprot:6486138-Amphidinium_carterae.7